MNNVEQLLEKSASWKGIVEAINNAKCPHSIAIIAHSSIQKHLVIKFAKLLLDTDKNWDGVNHPDLINAGKFLTQPSIDECRRIRSELALIPLISERKLAVVWEADKLSLEASNSLLKLTEEPPKHGHVLLIAEEDNFLPTIKSRVVMIYINHLNDIVSANKQPNTAEEIASWINSTRNKKTEEIYLDVEAWISYFIKQKNLSDAATLDAMTKIMRQKRLSVSMIQDVIIANLKEGVSTEEIFGDLWET